MGGLRRAYSAVERFALIYLAGMCLSIAARLYLDIRTPWFPQLLLPIAAWASAWKLRRLPQSAPTMSEYLLAVAGCTVVLGAAKIWVAWMFAATAQMSGPALWTGMIQRTFWESVLVALFLSSWFGRYIVNAPAKGTPAPEKGVPPATSLPATRHPVFALNAGFASLGTADFETIRLQDARILGPLFAHSQTPEPGKVPAAKVLFLYARLNEDGTICGVQRPVGIRQVIEATKAELVVLAVDNAAASVQAAVGLPGPKTANIVFVLERKGELLALFMSRVFNEMRLGKDMLSAWVRVAPQSPQQPPDQPATILVAEAGKIAFPLQANTPED